MNYKPLFNIVLRHQYAHGQICRNFDIQPLAGTAQWMKRYRLHFRGYEDRIAILGEMNPNGNPRYSIAEDTAFQFRLKLKDKLFHEYTDFPSMHPSKLLVFSNEAGKKELKESQQKPALAVLEKNTFGVICIHKNKSLRLTANVPTEFSLTFKAQKQYWEYYVIADLETDEFEIRDPKERIFRKIKQTPRNATPVGKALLEKHPDAHVYLFRSRVKMMLKERGLKGIRLLRNGSPFIPNLASRAPEAPYRIINTRRVNNGIAPI